MKTPYAVVDVGTTNVKLFIYDEELRRTYFEAVRTGLISAVPGTVEQDPRGLYKAIRHLLSIARERGANILGIATYRGSVIAWRKDGEPLTKNITWMDERGRQVVERFPPHLKLLSKMPILSSILSPQTPVVLYKWMIDNVPGLHAMLRRGEAYVGTLESYIIYRLTGRYLADATNAALTGLLDPRSFSWMGLPRRLLSLPIEPPELKDNVDNYGVVDGLELRAVIADQQAAAVGEGCIKRGRCKVTHGTGTFVDVALGDRPKLVGGGLIPLVILKVGGLTIYGIEGFVPATGTQVDWLIRNGFFKSYEEFDELALKSKPYEVLFIPGFAGMRVPKLPSSSGIIWGLSLEKDKSSVARAVIEGIAFSVKVIIEAIESKTGVKVDSVRADGGLSKSTALLKIMADVLGVPVMRQREVEMTGRGVALLLAVSEGAIRLEDLEKLCSFEARYEPEADPKIVEKLYQRWKRLVSLASKQPLA